jgi:gamma-glutamyltranspeptidase / glutathione hydrolase
MRAHRPAPGTATDDGMRAGVAAGHPATADVGVEILAEGGTAADAVVAMALASCVGETVMSGLLAGCHAIVFDGSRVLNLDGFAAVPSAHDDLVELPIAFGEEIVTYSIGPASCAVPGLPAALGELSRSLGRLPWTRLVEPAARLARDGVPLPAMHERSLEMLGALFSLGRGGELFVREGRTLVAGDVLRQPGLVDALEAIAEEGADSVYRGSIAEALLRIEGLVLSGDDLREYRARWRDPVLVDWCGHRVATRGGLSGIPQLLSRLPRFAGLDETDRVLTFVEVLETDEAGGEHTTNMVAVDGQGRACVLTHSLGVGAGCWVPGLDLQLNNLLGETDIAYGEPQPRDHLESRMAPTLAFDGEGLALGIGSAGATRLRTALCGVLAGILDEGLEPDDAVSRPRVHPTPSSIDAEPGVDERALKELEARGRDVRRWERFHHYFGGVSCVGRTGAAGDPRRSGAAILL